MFESDRLWIRPTTELPEHEGNGFAREASRALMQVARSHFNMERLCAITHPDNVASTRLLESLGFKMIKRVDLEEVKGESLYFEIDL